MISQYLFHCTLLILTPHTYVVHSTFSIILRYIPSLLRLVFGDAAHNRCLYRFHMHIQPCEYVCLGFWLVSVLALLLYYLYVSKCFSVYNFCQRFLMLFCRLLYKIMTWLRMFSSSSKYIQRQTTNRETFSGTLLYLPVFTFCMFL